MASSNLPFVSSNIPPDLRQFLERVRETLGGDTFVRRVDYLGGTVPRNPGEPPGPGPNPIPLPCGSPVTPTAPTGFQVFPGFSGFLLQWDMPEYCGHDRTEVYGLRHDGVSDDLTVKNMLGESKGVLYSHVVQRPGDYWCFWIKHVNVNDVEGPFVAASKCGTTALDPGVLLNTLKKQISESELYDELGQRINRMDLTGTGLIKENELRRTEIENLAQTVSEISVISGNRVFMSVVGSPPEEGQVCQFNGAIITENKYTHTAITSQNTCEDAGGVWGYYGFKHGDLWYQRSDWSAPSGATESVTQLTWNGTAWATSVTRTIYKQAIMPAVGTKGNLWYDTSANAKVLWHYDDGSEWQFIIDYFVNIVADSRIIDFSQARVGVCIDNTNPSYPVLSEEITRASCEAQSNHIWKPEYPVATTIKQVGVSIPAHCLINGKINSDYNISTCAAAGGTWVADSAIGLEQQMQAQQGVNGDLYAQYSVKIDNNGFVSGFGLSSETKEGVPFSQFLIRADRFALANPSHTGIPILDITLVDAPTKKFALRTDTDHGMVAGDLFNLQGVVSADTGWQKVRTVDSVTSTTRLLFYATDVTDTAPDASKGYTSKVSVPFVVTTTPTYLYGPTSLTLTAANISAMTSGYGLKITLVPVSGATVGPVTLALTDPIAADIIEYKINNSGTLNTLISATVNVARNRVEIIEKDTQAHPLSSITAQWAASGGTSTGTRPITLTIPAGVYIDNAFINKATINWAQIDQATIDWLTVVRQLRANDIVAGNISVGNCIGSANFVTGSTGWRVCGDGSSEFQNTWIRGTLSASTILGGSATDYYTGDGFVVSPAGYFRAGAGTSDGTSAGYATGVRVTINNPTTLSNRSFKVDVGVSGATKTLMQFSDAAASCFLRSSDYVVNTSGWTINGDGSAEFGTLHLRSGSVTNQGYAQDRAVSGKTLTGYSAWSATYSPTNGDYAVGDKVWYGTKSQLYWCKTVHTSAVGKEPTNTTYWIPWTFSETVASPLSNWSSSTSYVLGNVVWYNPYSSVYVCRTNHTNQTPPSGNSSTYWVKITNYNELVSVAFDITNADTDLGALFWGRFDVEALIAMGSTSPSDRDVSTIDMELRMVLVDASGSRSLLATSGYYLPCVGKKDATYHRFQTQVSDLTRVLGSTATSGTVHLYAANWHGFSSVPMTVTNSAITYLGTKR